MLAANKGNLGIVKVLIQAGANVNQQAVVSEQFIACNIVSAVWFCCIEKMYPLQATQLTHNFTSYMQMSMQFLHVLSNYFLSNQCETVMKKKKLIEFLHGYNVELQFCFH